MWPILQLDETRSQATQGRKIRPISPELGQPSHNNSCDVVSQRVFCTLCPALIPFYSGCLLIWPVFSLRFVRVPLSLSRCFNPVSPFRSICLCNWHARRHYVSWLFCIQTFYSCLCCDSCYLLLLLNRVKEQIKL